MRTFTPEKLAEGRKMARMSKKLPSAITDEQLDSFILAVSATKDLDDAVATMFAAFSFRKLIAMVAERKVDDPKQAYIWTTQHVVRLFAIFAVRYPDDIKRLADAQRQQQEPPFTNDGELAKWDSETDEVIRSMWHIICSPDN